MKTNGSGDAFPAEFRRRFRSHNIHSVMMAAFSFAAALLIWNLAYFFFVLILLGLTTTVRGDEGPDQPLWIGATAFVLAVVLLVWGVLDRLTNRYTELHDRPIIGWHLFVEIALLPVRLTFAIGENAGAVLTMNSHRLQRAWDLLTAIAATDRAPLSSLTLIEPNPIELHRTLHALQITGCIDLHPGEQDWYYSIRSSIGDPLQHRLARHRTA